MCANRIDYAASFWTVEVGEWPTSFVKVRFQAPGDADLADNHDGAAASRINELVHRAPNENYAERSIEVYADSGCASPKGVSPVLIDVDREQASNGEVVALARNVLTYLKQPAASYRLYRSGTGFHIEIHPQALQVAPYAPRSWYESFVRQVQQDLGAAPAGGRACVDVPRLRSRTNFKLMRMVGSDNAPRKGVDRRKLRITAEQL